MTTMFLTIFGASLSILSVAVASFVAGYYLALVRISRFVKSLEDKR